MTSEDNTRIDNENKRKPMNNQNVLRILDSNSVQ